MVSTLLNNFTGSFKHFFKGMPSYRAKDTLKQQVVSEADFDLRGSSFLIADDDDLCKFVFARYLQRWNGKADIAKTGAEALEMIKENRYDVILMDIEMPVMDGIEATTRIRQLEEAYYKTVPILAITSLNIVSFKAKLASAGMDDCISKEARPEDLYQKISYYLDRAHK